MSENEPSFEVRERRRFREAPGAGEPQSGAVDAPGASNSTGDATGSESAPPAASTGSANPAPEQAGGTGAGAGGSGDLSAQAGADPASSGSAVDYGTAVDDPDGPLPDINTTAMLQFAIGSLSHLAWQNMGLVPNPSTGKIAPNLAEARLAIDSITALLPVMAPHLDERARRDMQTLLSNLRINFVEQSKRQTS